MLQVMAADVKTDPFPHVVTPQILPAGLYTRLRAEYPTGVTFETSTGTTLGQGRSTGVGTGFDIYHGDTAYADLVARSPAGAELDGFVNS